MPNLHFTPTRRSFPYRFSGKERLDRAGLPLYDFGARWYNPATPAWTTPDPLAEKYYDFSPYAYCAGNPVNLMDDSGESPHIIIGVIIGGVVNGGIALYQGKTGRELLGAVAGGAMFGAITAASGGANLLASAGYGLAGGIASSITEQVIGEGSVDIGQVVVGGVSGAAAGAISSAAGSFIEKTSTKAIRAIDRKYASQGVQNEIKNEVKKEFRNVGRSFGKSTNRELNTTVAERIETLSGTDKTVVKALSSTIDKAQGEIVGWGMEELTKWTYERIQNE